MRGIVLWRPLLALILLAGACSQHSDPTSPEPGPTDVVEVGILNFSFEQPELRVSVGTTVRWRNTTSTFHTVTPDGHSAWSEWQTSGVDETFDVRFGEPGTYAYFCQPHRGIGMTGTVVVE